MSTSTVRNVLKPVTAVLKNAGKWQRDSKWKLSSHSFRKVPPVSFQPVIFDTFTRRQGGKNHRSYPDYPPYSQKGNTASLFRLF
jgi:hypothetical protein